MTAPPPHLNGKGFEVKLNSSRFNGEKIAFDPAKRANTLAERGLDFADVARLAM